MTKYMKSYTKALIVTALCGMPLVSQAETNATINISAEVTKECTINVDNKSVDFGRKSGLKLSEFAPQTVNVTTNCGGGVGQLTFTSSGANADKLLLTDVNNKDSTINVSLKVGEKLAAFASDKFLYDVKQNTEMTPLTFNLLTSDKTNGGVYKGVMTVDVAPL